MMKDHEFCDNCPGCRPAMLDAEGKVLPLESPLMLAVNWVWDYSTTYQERKAFIELTLHNSQLPSDVSLAKAVLEKMQSAILSLQ
jgi:hypothetical protein